MLIFIENTPRAYEWGSRDALPELLGVSPTGEPQAELWLGAHPGDPATVAKATPTGRTLIDLIESDPERYGVDGGQLPFLLKVLAIGAPLSLQVHPDKAQAEAGFAAEEAAGVPRDARERNYGDANHKPELLVALSETVALSGFRPLAEAKRDLEALAAASEPGRGRIALEWAAARCGEADTEQVRRELLVWALSGGEGSQQAIAAIAAAPAGARVDPPRLEALRTLTAAYPGDPGVFVSLLLHLVRLAPGEAIFLQARHLHAYMSGIAVEVMAASDNVLRAGLTQKHVDADEVCRVVELGELDEPRISARRIAPGLLSWDPAVADFRMMRARLCGPEQDEVGEGSPLLRRGADPDDSAEIVRVEAPYPLVMIATSGRVRVERHESVLDEVASLRRGQSLYVSAGGCIELSGTGEVFLATVGRDRVGVS